MTLHSRAPRTRRAVRNGQTALVAFALASLAAAQQSDPTVGLVRAGRLWTHASGGTGNVGRVVAIGNHGAQILTDKMGFAPATQLYSATATDPGAPSWQDSYAYHAESGSVALARTGDRAVAFHIYRTDFYSVKQPELRVYRDGLQLERTLPFPFVVAGGKGSALVSESGDVVAAWCHPAPGGRSGLITWRPAATAEHSYMELELYGDPKVVRISRDGSTVLCMSQMRTVIVDAHNGVLLHEHTNFSGYPMAGTLSEDGRLVVKYTSGGALERFRREGTGYVALPDVPLGGGGTLKDLRLSHDGRRLFAAFDLPLEGAPLPSRVAARVFDLGATPSQLEFEYVVVGDGQYSLRAVDLELAAQETHFALATSGDQSGQAPELLVFARDGSGRWSLVFEGRVQGSALDVDLSADGRRVVLAAREGHQDALIQGSRIDVFDLAERDLIPRGTARSTGSVEVHLRADPGAVVNVLRSRILADPPLVIPGAGTLYLAPGSYAFAGQGVADDRGLVAIEVAVPPGYQPGDELFFQGVVRSQRRLTADYGRLRVMP